LILTLVLATNENGIKQAPLDGVMTALLCPRKGIFHLVPKQCQNDFGNGRKTAKGTFRHQHRSVCLA
jgi:hypothetical protein